MRLNHGRTPCTARALRSRPQRSNRRLPGLLVDELEDVFGRPLPAVYRLFAEVFGSREGPLRAHWHAAPRGTEAFPNAPRGQHGHGKVPVLIKGTVVPPNSSPCKRRPGREGALPIRPKQACHAASFPPTSVASCPARRHRARYQVPLPTPSGGAATRGTGHQQAPSASAPIQSAPRQREGAAHQMNPSRGIYLDAHRSRHPRPSHLRRSAGRPEPLLRIPPRVHRHPVQRTHGDVGDEARRA